jgi:MFS family permease
MYAITERGRAFGYFFFGNFFGPLVGPIIGGFLSESAQSWRATFWFSVAFGCFGFILIFFFLPETYRDDAKWDAATNIDEKEDKLEDNVQDDEVDLEATTVQKRKSMNMFGPVRALFHPFVFLTSFMTAVAFGGMFAVETIIPTIYSEKFGLNTWQTGKISNLIGSTHRPVLEH